MTIDAHSSIHDIEKFTEGLCDQLFVNETYFGNILMTLSELYNLVRSQGGENRIDISYNTDFLLLNIIIKGIDQILLDELSYKIALDDLDNTQLDERVFLIQTLSDNISIVEEKTLELSFDISAIHHKIYRERAQLLHEYFKKRSNIKVVSDNDHH